MQQAGVLGSTWGTVWVSVTGLPPDSPPDPFYCSVFFFFFKEFLFLERGERREKERERNINVWLPLVYPVLGTRPTTQACVLTGN